MDHPDFRVRKKIFASLGYPNEKYGMVKLQPEQQESFARTNPNAFAPVKGGWGRRGATQVHLENADERTLHSAMAVAYKGVAAKRSSRGKT